MLNVLEQAATECGLTVRRDKGNFQSGRCIVKGQRVVFVNRAHPIEFQLSVLAKALQGEPIDDFPMRPAVREAVRQLMQESSLASP